MHWPNAGASFAVPGNHEYKSGAHGFFKKFLPVLGGPTADSAWIGQGTSYFCVDIGHWRLIGLDTGRRSVHYAGIELIVAALRATPGIERRKT